MAVRFPEAPGAWTLSKLPSMDHSCQLGNGGTAIAEPQRGCSVDFSAKQAFNLRMEGETNDSPRWGFSEHTDQTWEFIRKCPPPYTEPASAPSLGYLTVSLVPSLGRSAMEPASGEGIQKLKSSDQKGDLSSLNMFLETC